MSFGKVNDRLSSLPEETVSHILSLMPTKFAVRTSILSKRWRHSWMFLTNLNFEAIHPIQKMEGEVYKLTNFVDRVLKFCKPSQVQLFRLHFPAHEVKNSRVSKWIDEAVRLNACVLDICVNMLSFTSSMLTCKTLTELRLDRAFYNDVDWEFPCSVYLPCLKTLDIAGYNVCLVSVFKLISGCPVLESLSLLVRVPNKEEKEGNEYIFDIPTLKRLKLTRGFVSNVFTLNVPNLEYLYVGGELTFLKMEDVSSLVEASISFCKKPNDSMLVQLLEGIRGVKSLSIEHVTSFIDHLKNDNPFTQPQSFFPNVTQLKLTGFRHFILPFLESFPELKHLYVEKFADPGWIKPKQVPACMLTNLTTLKLSNCNWQKCDGFLEYMLANAKVLNSVTVTWEDASLDEDNKRLFARLLILPKASKCCVIHLVT